MWYLSPITAHPNIQKAAKTYGGAIRHSAASREKPMPSLRMIGRKYAMAYVLYHVSVAQHQCVLEV